MKGTSLDAIELLDADHNDLSAQLLTRYTHDPLYDATVRTLQAEIAPHVRHEREEMFPKARTSGLDLARLGELLSEGRQELQAVSEALREDALVSVAT
jgi:hypothetical protein